jgi:2-polyprenyl-3-methyl-5-hydroxy-6-metoxy-1,4-benzoquinol methylase
MIRTDEKYGGVATRGAPSCYLCGNLGVQLYQDRLDLLFNAPGLWDFRRCSNPSCALIWMDPLPLPRDIGKLYSHYYTHRDNQGAEVSRFRELLRFIRDCYLADRYGYVDLVRRWQRPIGRLLYLFPSKRSVVDFDIMCLPACPGLRLLEIGCGSGAFLARMRRLGWDVCGLDPDPAAVSWGRHAYGLDVGCGTLDQADFPVDSFDVITMNHVIEHVHDPMALLAECQRILRPGGKLILTTPNANSWGHKIFARYWRGLEPPRHFMIFSLRNLEECTRRSNFHTLTLRSISRWGRDIFVASRQIRQQGKQDFLGGVWARFEGYCFQVFENVAELFSVWSGEEIYFVGQKSHGRV